MRERFDKLKFKIHGAKGLVLEQYPVLAKYEPIIKFGLGRGDLDKILRYCIYLYDPQSDLRNEYEDLKERKAEALALAGFKSADKSVTNGLENFYAPYDDIIHCFLREVYHNRKLREWHTLQQELDDFTKIRNVRTNPGDSDFDPKKRSELNKLCDEIHKRLDSIEQEVFGTDEVLKESFITDRWSSPEKFASPTLKLQP
jgi:hypothetical protein